MSGIVKAVLIENHGIGERTDLQQPVPVAGVAGQSGNFQPDDQADVVHAHLTNEFLETLALGGRSAGLSQVAVDDHDAIGMPAECDSSLAKSILTLGAF